MLDVILKRKLHFRRENSLFIGENILFQDLFNYVPTNILENTFCILEIVYSEPKRNWWNAFASSGINEP